MTRTKAILTWLALGGAVESAIVYQHWDDTTAVLRSMYVWVACNAPNPVPDLETRNRRIGATTPNYAGVAPTYVPFNPCEAAPAEWRPAE
jgi:hypothetical protein